MKMTKALNSNVSLFYMFNFLMIAAWGVLLTFNKQLAIQYFAPLFLLSLFVILLFGLRSMGKAFNHFNLPTKSFVIFQVLFWGAAVLCNYPGYYSMDTFLTIENVNSMELNSWQTLVFGMICHSLSLLDPSLFGLTCLQLIVYFSILFQIFKIKQVKSWTAVVFLSIFSLLPLHQMTILFLNRDVLFGLLSCYLLFFIVQFAFSEKKEMEAHDLLHILFVLFVVSEIRQDGKIYYLLFPVFLYMMKICRLKHIVLSVSGVLALSIGLNVLWNRVESIATAQKYQLTTIIHSLNYLVNTQSESFSSEDKKIIDQVIPFESLLTSYHPYQIRQFHEGRDRLPVPEAEWNKFRWLYIKKVIKHFNLFFSERINMFASALNILPHSMVSLDLLEDTPKEFVNLVDGLDIKRLRIFSKLRSAHKEVLSQVYGFLMNWTLLRLLFASPLIWFVFCFFWLKEHPGLELFYRASFVFIFSRGILIFWLTPEPHMTYYSPLIYFPFFFILLASDASSILFWKTKPRLMPEKDMICK